MRSWSQLHRVGHHHDDPWYGQASICPEVLQWHNTEHVARCSVHVLGSKPVAFLELKPNEWKFRALKQMHFWNDLHSYFHMFQAFGRWKGHRRSRVTPSYPINLNPRRFLKIPCFGKTCCLNLLHGSVAKCPRCRRWEFYEFDSCWIQKIRRKKWWLRMLKDTEGSIIGYVFL